MVETNELEYAVYINVSNDDRTISDVNMVNGEIKFITNDITGLVYEDDTPATGFQEGFLVEKPINGLSNKIDISEGGAMASLNTCKITIDNNANAVAGTSFMSNLLSNAVYLINSRIQVYVVIDGVMYSRFGGVLSESAFNEKYLIFTAKDVNEDNFKNMPENDNEQIVYGDVGYTPINKIASTDQEVSIFSGIGHTYKKIKTLGENLGKTALSMTIPQDLYEKHFHGELNFVGWYVKARPVGDISIKSGYDEAIKIIGSSVTSSFIGNGRYTYLADLILDHPFEELLSSAMIGKAGLFPEETSEDSDIVFNTNLDDPKFLFDLISFNAEYVVSETEIASIDKDPSGLPYLFYYDETTNNYVPNGTAISYDEGKLKVSNNNESLAIKNVDYGNVSDTSPNGTYLTGAKYKILEGYRGSVDSNDKFNVDNVVTHKQWVNSPELIDGDYTNTISTDKGTTTFFGTELAYNYCFNYAYKYENSTEPGAYSRLDPGVLIELDVSPDVNFEDFDEMYLSMGIGVNLSPLISFPNFNRNIECPLFIRTLDRVSQDYKAPSGTDNTLAKLSRTPLNESRIDLNRAYNPDTDPSDYEYAYIETQFYDDAKVNYRSEDNVIAPMIAAPEEFENPTIPDQTKFHWGGSFTTDSTGDYEVLEQSITEKFVLDTNPIVTDKDGNKKIYLWITGDPNQTDVFTTTVIYFWLSNIKLVGMNETEAEELYVKTTGEAFPVTEQSIGSLTYNEDLIALVLEEVNIKDPVYIGDTTTVYFKTQDLNMIASLQETVVGDRITIRKDVDTYITIEKTHDDIYTTSGYNYFKGDEVGLGSIDFATGDLCDVSSPYRRNVGNVYSMFQNMLEVKNSFTNVNYNDLSVLRSTWEASRTITRATNSKNLIKNLAQQSFVGVFTNRFGNVELDAYKDYADFAYNDVDDYWYWKWLEGVDFKVFNNGNINNKSIKNVKSTPISNIINNIGLEYNFDYATNSFTDNYYVTNVSADNFPDPGSDYSSFSNIADYVTAKVLWDQGHETYVRNSINKNLDKKKQLKECNWYYNPRSGGLMDKSIHFYITNLVEWITESKNVITFRIPLNSDNIVIDLLERVTFSDVLLTGGSEILGWVTSVKTDIDKREIELEITTVPTDLIPTYQYIDESSRTIGDQIDETPDTDINVDEQFTI